MAYLSSGHRTYASAMVADRDRNDLLLLAAAIHNVESSISATTGTLPANLVDRLIPKQIHPLKILNLIAYMLPGVCSFAVLAPAYQDQFSRSAPTTFVAAKDPAAAAPNQVAAAIC